MEQRNKLVRIPTGQEFEFEATEHLRHDIAILLGHDALVAKYKEHMNREK